MRRRLDRLKVPRWRIPRGQSHCVITTVEHVVIVRVILLNALTRESPPVLATPINSCAIVSFQAAGLCLLQGRTSTEAAACAEGVAAALVQTLPVLVLAASLWIMARPVHARLEPAMLLRAGLANDTMILGDVMELIVMKWIADHLVAGDEVAELDRDNLLKCGVNAAIFRIPKVDEGVRTSCRLEAINWSVERVQNRSMLKGDFWPHRSHRGEEACCQG